MIAEKKKTAHACRSTHFDFNVPGFEVESNLELEVFHDWRENLEPVLFQWRVSVCWDRYFSHLVRTLKHAGDNPITRLPSKFQLLKTQNSELKDRRGRDWFH